jgi:hypothetical protein
MFSKKTKVECDMSREDLHMPEKKKMSCVNEKSPLFSDLPFSHGKRKVYHISLSMRTLRTGRGKWKIYADLHYRP